MNRVINGGDMLKKKMMSLGHGCCVGACRMLS